MLRFRPGIGKWAAGDRIFGHLFMSGLRGGGRCPKAVQLMAKSDLASKSAVSSVLNAAD